MARLAERVHAAQIGSPRGDCRARRRGRGGRGRLAVSSADVLDLTSRASPRRPLLALARLPRWRRRSRSTRRRARPRRAGRTERRVLTGRRLRPRRALDAGVRRRGSGLLRRPRDLLRGPSLRDGAVLRGAGRGRRVRAARGLLWRRGLRRRHLLLAAGHVVSHERRVLQRSPLRGWRLHAARDGLWSRRRRVLPRRRVPLGLGVRGRSLRDLRWRWRDLLRGAGRVRGGPELHERSLRHARPDLRRRWTALLRG